MIASTANILLAGSVLLLISIVAGKTSSRFGVPTLLFFLIVGVLAGSEGIGGIYFDNPHITEFIGVVALNFILFSGGLDTDWKHIKPILWRGVALSTIGVFLTAFSVGLFVHYALGFSLVEGLLLGAIVSATDAAAVFSILRSKGIRLKGSIGEVLELESGSNDPMAYFLTVSLTGIIATGHLDAMQLIITFLKGFIIGGAVGFAMGKFSNWIINKIKLDSEGLYPVLVLGLAMFTYSATDFIGGNGFLAIYLSALVLGNSNFVHRRSLMKFYEGQAWLMQIVLFLTLGLLVFPSKVIPVIGIGLLISAFLIFIARPIGVFTSLAFFKTSARSKAFISWVGLRGAVPIVFATYPVIAGLAKAEMIFNLVFFISVSSVLLQGTLLPAVADWLKVKEINQEPATVIKGSIKEEMKEIVLLEGSKAAGEKIVYLHFPSTAHIMAIKRGDQFIQPNGSTRLLAGDKLFILAKDEEELALIRNILG
jgi:cell volume regulation protein A